MSTLGDEAVVWLSTTGFVPAVAAIVVAIFVVFGIAIIGLSIALAFLDDSDDTATSTAPTLLL